MQTDRDPVETATKRLSTYAPMVVLNFDQPAFPVSYVASAIGASLDTVRSWIKRDGIKSFGEKEEEVFLRRVGSYYYLSPRKALHIAATFALVGFGMPSRKASLAAAHWTEAGTTDRLPADVFKKSGATFLVAYHPNSEPPAEVVHQSNLAVACSKAPAVVVNLNTLTAELFNKLGMTP